MVEVVPAAAIGGFVAALSLAAFVVVDHLAERRRVAVSLRRLPEIELDVASVRARELATPVASRILAPGLARIGERVRALTPGTVLDRLGMLLERAGSPAGWDAERLLATKLLLLGGLAASALVVVPGLGGSALQAAIAGPVLGAVGWFLPELLLRSRASERQGEMQRALPDCLDLLAISVKAGLGFDQAVARVAGEVGGPLGDELRRMLREMQLGRSRVDALRSLGERNEVPDLQSFVLAMIQADVFGVSISRVLEVQAREMRIKRRQRAEELAQKVPVKILFPVVFCIFPALFLVLLGPAAIQVYRALVAAS